VGEDLQACIQQQDQVHDSDFALSEPAGLKTALSPIEEAAWKPDDLLLTIKGAPDIIVERCSKYVGEDGNVHALDAAMNSVIEDVKNEWSSQGKRAILLARKALPGHRALHFPEPDSFETDILQQVHNNLTLVGLIGIVDAPRDEIPRVVRILQQAGTRISWSRVTSS